jgi:predicted metal-dependent HD superfamily phosphohydrolase
MIAEMDILAKTINFAEDKLSNNVSNDLHYHNLAHTQEVVKAALEIGKASGLGDRELEILQVAAWFHDSGFTKGCDDHENESIKIASEFLKLHKADKSYINEVVGCIEATKMPQTPHNLLQEVICDADLYHLSTDVYFEKCKLLRKEWEINRDEPFSEMEWLQNNVKFLKSQEYFTPYALEKLKPGLEKNLNIIKERLKVVKNDGKYKEKLEKENLKLIAKLEAKPTRGIETMFRITSKNHLQLSAMADNKANIMISINTIILSIIMSVLIRKLEEYPHFIIPTLILTSVCLITIVFSVLATRPNVSRGKFTRSDIENKKTNLLFFGNFHGMDIDDYMWGMKEMMKDGDYLYSSLIKDVYYLGIVLGKKYKLLRIAYTIFMIGLVISVISFMVAEFLARSLMFF